MTNVEAFMIHDGSYVDATRDEIIATFGSFDRYADEALGLDASVLSELRATLLDEQTRQHMPTSGMPR